VYLKSLVDSWPEFRLRKSSLPRFHL
jgi:hypothetical protein